jgi:hypothetical protein
VASLAEREKGGERRSRFAGLKRGMESAVFCDWKRKSIDGALIALELMSRVESCPVLLLGSLLEDSDCGTLRLRCQSLDRRSHLLGGLCVV